MPRSRPGPYSKGRHGRQLERASVGLVDTYEVRTEIWHENVRRGRVQDGLMWVRRLLSFRVRPRCLERICLIQNQSEVSLGSEADNADTRAGTGINWSELTSIVFYLCYAHDLILQTKPRKRVDREPRRGFAVCGGSR